MGARDGAEGSCSSFALAPDHSGALAWDGALFRVRLLRFSVL
jgi:hypothetical protein